MIPAITWIKLRGGISGGGFSFDGKFYHDLGDFDAAKAMTTNLIIIGREEKKEKAPSMCIWPCDAWVISWHRFVKKREIFDIRIYMLIFTLAVTLPSFFLASVVCWLLGLPWLICILPMWFLCDATIIMTYYVVRFGSDMACAMTGMVRFHPCFKAFFDCVSSKFGVAMTQTLAAIERESKPTMDLRDAERALDYVGGTGVDNKKSSDPENTKKNADGDDVDDESG